MKTILRFATVGCTTTALDVLVFNLGVIVGLPALWAHLLSSLIILPLSFLGQRAAFRARGPLRGQALRFAVVTGVGVLCFQPVVLSEAMRAVALVGLAQANAAKGAAVIAGILWNLVWFRWFVFPPYRQAQTRGATNTRPEGSESPTRPPRSNPGRP